MTYSTFCLDLILFLNEPDHARYRSFITTSKIIPEVAVEIINNISEYCTWASCESVSDWRAFALWYETTKMGANSVAVDVCCDALSGHAPTGTAESVLQSYIDKKYCEDISQEADEVYSSPPGKYHPTKLDKLQAILDAYHATSVRTAREVAGEDGTDVLEALQSAKRSGLAWPLESLNQIIGPLSKELVIVASRPDGGKTTFLAHTAQHMAQQLTDDKVVLWFNNEEAISRIKQRVVCSTLAEDAETVANDPITSHAAYTAAVNNRIVFVEDSNNISKIERYLTKYNPGLIIIDQLYKVRGNFGDKSEMEAERFRQLCEWARNIGKHVAPVIVSNQLDSSAENEKTPPMNSLYGSKTGAQGEADVILMIGRTYSDPDKRYLSTPKNKLTGRVQSTETLLDKDIARFIDL